MSKLFKRLVELISPDTADMLRREGQLEERLYTRRVNQYATKSELRQYLGYPVICIDRSTGDLYIGLGLSLVDLPSFTPEVPNIGLLVHDYVINKEVVVDGVYFAYTEDRLRFLAEISKNLRYKLFINTRETRDIFDTEVVNNILGIINRQLQKNNFFAQTK